MSVELTTHTVRHATPPTETTTDGRGADGGPEAGGVVGSAKPVPWISIRPLPPVWPAEGVTLVMVGIKPLG